MLGESSTVSQENQNAHDISNMWHDIYYEMTAISMFRAEPKIAERAINQQIAMITKLISYLDDHQIKGGYRTEATRLMDKSIEIRIRLKENGYLDQIDIDEIESIAPKWDHVKLL